MRQAEPRAMKEIHSIRLALYKEKKKMSSRQKANLANSIAKKIIKDYSLGIELLSGVATASA
jgi:hypothetical protein